MPYKDKKYAAYADQIYHAKKRGIPFLIPFDKWIDWWERNLGPDWLEKRGRKKQQYVMARLNDHGYYTLPNVICKTSNQNNSDRKINGTSAKGAKNGIAILTEKDVKRIRNSAIKAPILAVRYGVKASQIRSIRQGRSWRHLVKGG